MLKTMGNKHPAWKEEERLSVEERRKRYRCGSSYVPVSAIHPWNAQVDDILKNSRHLKMENCLKHLRKFGEQNDHTEDQANDELERTKNKLKQEVLRRTKPIGKYRHNEEINAKVALIRADITTLEVDAVVNAANRSLLGGGGVDGSIHRAAGKELLKECKTLNGANTGETKITRGYNLPAKYVLHTVGPVGEKPERLTSCYKTCLDHIKVYKIRSVAFCGVSTGIYGYPLYPASHIALNTVRQWLENEHHDIELIVFCTFLANELECYEELMPLYFPPKDQTTESVLDMYTDWAVTLPEKEEVQEDESEEGSEDDKEEEEEEEEAPSQVSGIESGEDVEKVEKRRESRSKE